MSLLAALLLSSVPAAQFPVVQIPNPVPEINMSAVRHLDCELGFGSGTMIANDTILTAWHVPNEGGGNCIDSLSGAKLEVYYKDEVHDIALMRGTLPDIPYMRYSCSGYKKGKTYYTTGYSGWGGDPTYLRQYKGVATGIVKDSDAIKDLRVLVGFGVPGQSGGPTIDYELGYQIGMVNVGWTGNWGKTIVNRQESTDLKNTILCKG